jgi:hypothetical protein
MNGVSTETVATTPREPESVWRCLGAVSWICPQVLLGLKFPFQPPAPLPWERVQDTCS